MLKPACPQKWQQAKGAQSAALPRNQANSVVALAAVIGSKNVEMLATRTLIIRGLRASRPAKVPRVKQRIIVQTRPQVLQAAGHADKDIVHHYLRLLPNTQHGSAESARGNAAANSGPTRGAHQRALYASSPLARHVFLSHIIAHHRHLIQSP